MFSKTSQSFKYFNNPSWTDFFLTNSSNSFEKCSTLETIMSGFHKLITTILQVKSDKLPPRIMKYRDYKILKVKYLITNFRQASNFDMNKFH